MANRKSCHTNSSSSPQRRTSLNVASFLITLCIIGLSISLADGNFAKKVNDMTRRLDIKLDNVFKDITIDYKPIEVNASYYSTSEFNPKGMAGLYNATGFFMNWTIPFNIIPEGIMGMDNGKPFVDIDYLKDNTGSLALKFAGLITLLVAFVLMLVFFPLCGFCFCCCRCCGKCGARSQPFDKKSDLCRKIIMATLLIVLGTLLLFGVVCAFVSNQQIQDGTEELPRNLKVSIQDMRTYLNTTNKELIILLEDNYGSFKNKMIYVLDTTIEIVFEELENLSDASKLQNVIEIAEDLNGFIKDFKTLKDTTKELRIDASQLNDALRKVKYDLLQTLNECQAVQQCSTLLNNYINNLGTEIDFNAMPDISNDISKLDSVLKLNIIEEVKKGEEMLQNIKGKIQNEVKGKLEEVKTSINSAGEEVKKNLDNMNEVIDNMDKNVLASTNDDIDTANRYIKDYSPYRYYVGIGMSCVLLLVAICIALGLICGICGKRPDSYSDDCCNKGAGSRFLMCGVGIMFLFSIILIVCTLVYFILGVTMQRVVCDTVKEPKESSLIKMVDNFVDFNNLVQLDVNLSTVIEECRAGKSIYTVLNLESKFDLNKIQNIWENYNIESSLKQFQDQLKNNEDLKDIKLLNEESKRGLDELVAAQLSKISFYKFEDEANKNLTSADLNEISIQLDQLIKLEDTGITQSILNQLKIHKLHIDTYQKKLVDPMIEKKSNLASIAKRLREKLDTDPPYEDKIVKLKEDIEKAEATLKVDGPEQLGNIAASHSEDIKKVVDGFSSRIVDSVQNRIGKCEPLSKTIDGAITSVCDKIVLPVNGFWFGVFWSLILFIPIIILSVKLATLYQKYDPYPGSMVEAEYLYDAYADRENIPLSGMHGKHGKKRKNKKNKRHERGGAYMPEAGDQPRDFPAGSHHQDARYADMAPKGYTAVQYHFPTTDGHWDDFPANGPPHYQRAPTEYDRPPPYYYPGTADPAPH